MALPIALGVAASFGALVGLGCTLSRGYIIYVMYQAEEDDEISMMDYERIAMALTGADIAMQILSILLPIISFLFAIASVLIAFGT